MPERQTFTFRIDDELREGLDAITERDGIQPGEQIRRAVKAWLELKGVNVEKGGAKKSKTRK